MDTNVFEPDWATISVRLFVCIAGIIGNIFAIVLIVVLCEYRKAVTHWYVLQLAIADTIFLLTLPFNVDEAIRNEWPFSSGMCKAKETILFLNYYASILFLVIMSIDRYIAVCHGFSDFLQKFRTKKAALIVTVATWILCLILCIPIMLYSGKAGDAPTCKCRYDFPQYELSAKERCQKEGFDTEEDIARCMKTIHLEPVKPACEPKSYKKTSPDVVSDNPNSNITQEEFEDYLYKIMLGEVIPSTKAPSAAKPSVPSFGEDCDYSRQGSGWSAFLLFNFIVMFVIPLLIMIFCYVGIIQKLQSTKSRTSKSVREPETTTLSTNTSAHKSTKTKRKASAATSRANAERNRVTIMCVVLVMLFIACWLPFHAVHVSKIFGMGIGRSNPKWCNLLPLVASLIAYMNSALNPYLYNFLGTRFGQRMKNTARRLRSSTSGSHGDSKGDQHAKRANSRSNSQTQTMMTHIFKGRISGSSSARSSARPSVDNTVHQSTRIQNNAVEMKLLTPKLIDVNANDT